MTRLPPWLNSIEIGGVSGSGTENCLDSDYPGAMNGLQLANRGQVERIVAAVDASLPVIEAAAAGGPGLLIVHHGMFWQGVQPVTGAFYRKLKIAMEAGLAIYSVHLPLDIHPEWGNNILLAKAIGLINPRAVFRSKGAVDRASRRLGRELAAELAETLGEAARWPGSRLPGRPGNRLRSGPHHRRCGQRSGESRGRGVDAFVTGEGPHWSYPLAEELGVNVFYGGHYATETFGVKALGEAARREFRHSVEFLDHPTGCESELCGNVRMNRSGLVRVTGIEPAFSSLGSSRSAIELHPQHASAIGKLIVNRWKIKAIS